MTQFEEVGEILERILKSIYDDRSKLQRTGCDDKGLITARRIERAAGSNLFNDNPEWFGITEHEGRVVRTYFQSNMAYNWRDYIIELHQEFPPYMDPEDPKHIRDMNKEREKYGLPPIQLTKVEP